MSIGSIAGRAGGLALDTVGTVLGGGLKAVRTVGSNLIGAPAIRLGMDKKKMLARQLKNPPAELAGLQELSDGAATKLRMAQRTAIDGGAKADARLADDLINAHAEFSNGMYNTAVNAHYDPRIRTAKRLQNVVRAGALIGAGGLVYYGRQPLNDLGHTQQLAAPTATFDR